MPGRGKRLDSPPEAFDGSLRPPLPTGRRTKGQREKGRPLPRLNAGEPHPDPRREEQPPPGEFVSEEHEADCSRFLEDVKAFIRRRSEAGLAQRHER
jgi:hypothetical protein